LHTYASGRSCRALKPTSTLIAAINADAARASACSTSATAEIWRPPHPDEPDPEHHEARQQAGLKALTAADKVG
jgi:hypothetical protein